MTTIFAVSSGRPPAAIAVVRVSGPDAIAGAETLAGRLPEPRRAGLRALHDPAGVLLDRALVLVFPGPDSATGEDLVELHCHGGRAVIDAVERALAALPGVRRAVAGEFTRRALINGRIDLAQAEGLGDLLSAETERQRLAALAGSEGRISACVRGWLDRLAMLSARIEAQLDFSDEDDVAAAGDSLALVGRDIAGLAGDMRAVLDQPVVDRLRDGVRVVIGGPPNSGKSTLINRLVEREVAIVSPISGTTRDRIEAPVVRDGLPYLITDTAGLADETEDAIERIGIVRAAEAIAAADILVWLGDDPPPRQAIWVHARADLLGRRAFVPEKDLAIAADDPATIAALWTKIAIQADALLPAEDALMLSRRQAEICRRAMTELKGASDPLIVAEQVRIAHRELASILGIDAGEQLLDTLFAKFCIGK